MKFRKKPVVIDAVQWNGNNEREIIDFMPSDKFSISRTFLKLLTNQHDALRAHPV